MMKKIRDYIENAFQDVENTKKTRELKEELYANLIEKYNDQIQNGKTEAQSYAAAIASIGDIDELVEGLKTQSPFKQVSKSERKKSALLISCAAMLYILSPLAVLFGNELFNVDVAGIGVMFLMIAAATGLIIYNHMTKPVYKRTDNTIIEEFKEWKGNTNRRTEAYKAFRSGFWGIIVALYLLISFIFGIWAYSWIIFIIAAAAQNIVKGLMSLWSDYNDE